jgi:hypothetical protein
MKRLLAGIMIMFFMAGFSFSADKGTQREAQAMVKKAASFLQKNGKEKAFPEFDNPKGKFVAKDLYVYVLDMNGRVVSHGANKTLIGKDMISIQDSDGVRFIEKIVDMAKAKGKGTGRL